MLKREKHPEEWREAELLAAQILTGQVALKNSTGGALNYHAVTVLPDWAETMDKTTQIQGTLDQGLSQIAALGG